MFRVLLIAAATLIASVAVATRGVLAQVPPVGARAEVRDIAGRLVATVEFRDGRGEVLVSILFPSPPTLTGSHGLRIHDVARCDPPDFLTAGGGFNPFGKKHGRQNPEGPQVGDLPNVNFSGGSPIYNTSAPGASLGAGPGSLLSPNRTALIVYAGDDDQVTDPDGKAGARIACGVIAAASPLAGQQPVPASPAASPVAAQQPLPPPAPTAPAPVKPLAGPVGAQPGAAVASPVSAQPGAPKPAASLAPSVVPTPTLLVVQPTAPPPVAAQPATQTTASGGPRNPMPAFLIAVGGVALMGGGWLLRRRARQS